LRIRVPSEFPGGFLEVKTWGDRPLVVLVRGGGLPTKSEYELSNFDDWISGKNVSVLRYRVPATSDMFRGMHQPRRMQEANASWNATSEGFARNLQERTGACPRVPPPVLGCETATFTQCREQCRYCGVCVKGRDGPQCNEACHACTSAPCLKAISACAGDASCLGQDALQCKSRCSGCMACMDSNDKDCRNCECCLDCLPVAAKCGILAHPAETQTQYIFVGVYNHRRYFNDVKKIHALTDVILKLDPQFAQSELPSSWLADLYDPFQDLSKIAETSNREVYPEGEQFVYDLSPQSGTEMQEQVRVYRDRMTLLHIPNNDFADRMMLSFTGSNITHVLVSTSAVPKTLFDFNSAPQVDPGRNVEITADREPALWCAIFGGADGWANVKAAKLADPSMAMSFSSSFICIGGFVVAVIVLTLLTGVRSFSECIGLDDQVPIWDRFWCFVTRQNNHHELTALTGRSQSGFVSSDVIDRNIEDQFLHRGGMAGDDGI